MKQKFSSAFAAGLMAFAVTGTLLTAASCHDRDNDVPTKYDHSIELKATASAGSNITSVTYKLPGSDERTVSTSGLTYGKTVKVPIKVGATENIKFTVKATGASASSTLKAEIYSDGQLEKEVNVSGQTLNADASFTYTDN